MLLETEEQIWGERHSGLDLARLIWWFWRSPEALGTQRSHQEIDSGALAGGRWSSGNREVTWENTEREVSQRAVQTWSRRTRSSDACLGLICGSRWGVGRRESEEVRTVDGQLAAFCEELEATMVRSHGALFLVPVLALLPTCCVTFGKSLFTLGLSFFTCKREGWTRPVTFK